MTREPKVLVVDDDAFIRRPLECILRREGFLPLTAVDGDDCMQQVSRDRPDLIILDVMLPGRNGLQVCEALRSTPGYADIPVILLSARPSGEARVRGLAAGANGFLTKPYVPSDLIRTVHELLSTD
ncbi:MAG: response regulator [bacterium]|nr:response regulator [bacterium]